MGCCVGSKGDKNSQPLKPNVQGRIQGEEHKETVAGQDEHRVGKYPEHVQQPETEQHEPKRKELDQSNFGIFELPQQSVVEVKGVNVYVPEDNLADVVHDEDVLSFRNDALPVNFAITVG